MKELCDCVDNRQEELKRKVEEEERIRQEELKRKAEEEERMRQGRSLP